MPLFDFAQVYVIAFFIGSGFIILSFFLGHMHDGDSGHGDAGHGGHLDFHGHHDAGHAHLDHSGHMHDSHGAHDDPSGHDSGHSHGDDHSHQSDTHSQARGHHSSSASNNSQNDLVSNVGRIAFSLLSPMTMSLFLMFFGIVGYFSLKLFPAIGLLTLIPSLIAGVLAVKIFKRLISLMMSKLSGATQISEWAAVGQEAEVMSTIKNGNVGEISYIIGNKMHNGIARCTDKSIMIEKGSKVIITDLDGSTAIVEPQKDFSVK
ncbi:MAG: NfeD family protein [Cyanobacteria bacterium TGS_CYA1]|nr:NfeD family protein [Cyanobacteria bacterium TGS_CYA1]